ncbi:hypothetical protein BgAZ_303720 [Babesia gibsoni]|uniref:Spen paralogue and orthologue SPOC C-terminal domain-containing protein n=1 Tax=Babesia gibsoni TaxID=33632 RepID=A0AAD8LL77_BABGI|nr:hypothetical protein BgAZ_303720 [Babesia gibsoni]
MELRLCDHLRKCAPHIFLRERVSPAYSGDGSDDGTSHWSSRGARTSHTSDYRDAQYTSSSRAEQSHYRQQEERPAVKVIWKGEMTRNGSKPMPVAAIGISGDLESVLTPDLTNIDITHRQKEEEVEKFEPVAVFYVRSQRSRETEAIDEYIEYFQQKERVGVAPLEDGKSIYICAPGTELFDKYPVKIDRTPILICIVAECDKEPSEAASSSPQQADGQNWLEQLNTITTMLGK